MQYRSIKVVNEKVEKVHKHKDSFLLMAHGRRISIKCKYVIMATGIEDIKPNIKNFAVSDLALSSL
jgi:thioredoxin reductase